MSTKTDLGLQRVQDLYAMHMELIRALSADLSDPNARKEIQKQMKQFGTLLSKVDHRYMGGEDVLESLRKFPSEVKQFLKRAPVSRVKARVKARAEKKTKPAKHTSKRKASKTKSRRK